ncbi:diguanylate cyclase [Erwiniaceae bacterium CAU 1747]
MASETLANIQHSRTQWLNSLLLGLLSLASTFYCLELIKISGQISPLWFSTALMTIVVFRNPLRNLPLLLGGCMLGVISANAFILGPDLNNLKFPLLNLAQALMGGVMLRLLLDHQAPLNTLYSWVKMLLAVGLCSPLLGAILACTLLNIPSASFTSFFSTWVASEVIGMLALGPVALLWQRDPLMKKRDVVETAITLLMTLALSWLALRYLPWSFAIVIVILFYSAVRLPRLGAFIVYLFTVSMISLMMALNLIAQDVISTPLLSSIPWLPFLLALVPSHLMTLVMHSFREERKHISESEIRFRHAMEYSAIGMALVAPGGKWLQVNKSLCRLFGYSQRELEAMTFQQLSHPDDLNADLTQMKALLAGEIASYSMEKRYLRSDGKIVWALLAVSLVRDSDRQPLYFISQIEDITGLKQTEKVNQQLMERITLANEAAGIGVWEWNLVTGEVNWDRRMFQLYHLPVSTTITQQSWINTLLPADRRKVITLLDDAVKNRAPVDMEYRIETRAGIRYIRCQGNIVADEPDTCSRMLGINQDVTAFRLLTDALDQERERMHITLDAINEAVISTDEQMQVIFMNPVAEKMTGWPQHHAVGKPITDILQITRGGEGPEQEIILSCVLPGNAEPATSPDQDLVLHNRAGEQFAINYSLSPLSTQEGDNIGSVMVIQDVSESREMFKRLRYSASHDMLTRLPNRASFEQRLKLLLIPQENQQRHHVLTFFDLDRFKAVNDSGGHAAGDALLRELSSIMVRQLRGSDFLARLGGDEFGMLLPECSLEDASEIAMRLVATISQHRFLWKGHEFFVGASAGLTAFDSSSNAVEVMAQADIACYQAKNSGRGQIAVYGQKTDHPPQP